MAGLRFHSFAALLVASLAFGSCSHYSKMNRDQRAYAKYVRKGQITRVKQQQLMKPKNETLPPSMPRDMTPSEPVETIETQPSDG